MFFKKFMLKHSDDLTLVPAIELIPRGQVYYLKNSMLEHTDDITLVPARELLPRGQVYFSRT